MTLKILKLPQAERDIEECFVHIAEDNLEIGLIFLEAFEKSVEQLAKFPFLGKALELKNDEFREMRVWHVTGYVSRQSKSSVSCTQQEISETF